MIGSTFLYKILATGTVPTINLRVACWFFPTPNKEEARDAQNSVV